MQGQGSRVGWRALGVLGLESRIQWKVWGFRGLRLRGNIDRNPAKDGFDVDVPCHFQQVATSRTRSVSA